MKYLIVGLGNIGAEYAHTRHNIGFTVLDALAEASSAVFTPSRYGSVAEIKYRGRTVILLKPSTYMNLSGKAVRYWVDAEKIARENLLVVVDDIALPFGALRMRAKGSDGGHNGLKNINELLGSDAYARLRFGIGGNFTQGHQADYVLGGRKVFCRGRRGFDDESVQQQVVAAALATVAGKVLFRLSGTMTGEGGEVKREAKRLSDVGRNGFRIRK